MSLVVKLRTVITLVDDSLGYSAEYRVDPNGIILDLGKFEGEPVYVPYYYELVMHGLGEHVSDQEDRIPIEDTDVVRFSELRGYKSIIIGVSDQGFVYHKLEA